MSKQPARFCLDETSFELNDDLLPNAEKFFEDMLDFVDRFVLPQKQTVVCWSELYYAKIRNRLLLYGLLYPEEGTTPEIALDDDLRKRLQLFVDRCPNWDEPLPPEETQRILERFVRIGEQQEQLAPSLSFVWEQITQKYAISCLRLVNKPEETGPQPVSIEGKKQTLHFITTEPQLRTFYREIPEVEDFNEEVYIKHTNLSFPALYFVPNIDKQFRRFSKTFPEIRTQVTQHLCALNDHFRTVFQNHKYAPDPTSSEMKAKCGVDMSPESPNTKRNNAAWEQRKITVAGKDLHCEWHTKLSWDTDRIHFHPGSPGIADGKIVIGIFAAHLET